MVNTADYKASIYTVSVYALLAYLPRIIVLKLLSNAVSQ